MCKLGCEILLRFFFWSVSPSKAVDFGTVRETAGLDIDLEIWVIVIH